MKNYSKEVYISGHGLKNIGLSVTVESRGTPDCQVGHFGYNFFFRTPYGVKGFQYCTSRKMEAAIEKVLVNKGFQIEGWR